MANNKPVGVAYSDPALTAFYLNAPVTKTASFSLGDSDNYVVCNGSAANVSVTLPSGSDYIGRTVTLKNLSGTYTVISASSNVTFDLCYRRHSHSGCYCWQVGHSGL